MSGPTREEIERAKTLVKIAAVVERIGEAQRIARAELEAEGWPAREPAHGAPEADEPEAPVPIGDAYFPFTEIEAKRQTLAAEGRAHGYDSLARSCGLSRATIVRRYKGRPSPGSPIPGVCDTAPDHPHTT